MELIDAVRLMGTFVSQGDERVRQLHGSEAVAMLREVTEAVEEYLQAEGPHRRLWEEFRLNPHDRAEDLADALDLLSDAHPRLGVRLSAFLDEYTFGLNNELPAVRTELVDEEDSVPYVRDLDTGLVTGRDEPEGGED
jgi:hypothetical protein